MRGQVQASVARLGRTPARERLAAWVDARVRKRQSERERAIVIMAALEQERRRELRMPWGRSRMALPRPPY